MAADLMQSLPGGGEKLSLHIAAGGGETNETLCGDDGSRNVISKALVRGINPTLVCPTCLQLMKGQGDVERVN